MKRIVKCCLVFALGFAVAGCSKGSSGGAGSGGSSKLREHKGVQLWKDGPYWAETNIGAENPWDYGYYFWWGDTIGYKRVNDAWVASDGSSSNFIFDNVPTFNKEQSVLSKEGWIVADRILAPEHDAAHAHWGGKWRMPTRHELKDLCDKCDWKEKTVNGVKGCVVSGRGDYASASIFLPYGGFGSGTSLYHDGSHGFYWSSYANTGIDKCSYGLFCYLSEHDTLHDYRDGGRTVRPVQRSREGQTPLVE